MENIERTHDDDIDIPLGKRDKLYRFFEILPGALSYSMIGALFVSSGNHHYYFGEGSGCGREDDAGI